VEVRPFDAECSDVEERPFRAASKRLKRNGALAPVALGGLAEIHSEPLPPQFLSIGKNYTIPPNPMKARTI